MLPAHIEGILPKGPYLPCVSMAGRALLAGYPRYLSKDQLEIIQIFFKSHVVNVIDLYYLTYRWLTV